MVFSRGVNDKAEPHGQWVTVPPTFLVRDVVFYIPKLLTHQGSIDHELIKSKQTRASAEVNQNEFPVLIKRIRGVAP